MKTSTSQVGGKSNGKAKQKQHRAIPCACCKDAAAAQHLSQIVGEKMRALDLCEECAQMVGSWFGAKAGKRSPVQRVRSSDLEEWLATEKLIDSMARRASERKARAAAEQGNGGKPKLADGWQTLHEAGMPDATTEPNVERVSTTLYYSPGYGFYLFDRQRPCLLNGKPGSEWDVQRTLNKILTSELPQGALFRFELVVGRQLATVKRLTRNEAISYCLRGHVPEMFRGEVFIRPKKESPRRGRTAKKPVRVASAGGSEVAQ